MSRQQTRARKALDRARGDRTWRTFADAVGEAGTKKCSHQLAYYWYRAGRVPSQWVRAVIHVAREPVAPEELNPDFGL